MASHDLVTSLGAVCLDRETQKNGSCFTLFQNHPTSQHWTMIPSRGLPQNSGLLLSTLSVLSSPNHPLWSETKSSLGKNFGRVSFLLELKYSLGWLCLVKISSKVQLAWRSIIPIDEVTCTLSNDHQECADHLLLQCTFARSIWYWWLGLWNLNQVFPKCLSEAFEQWAAIGSSPFLNQVWRAIFSIIIWSTWKEKNSHIFRNVSYTFDQIQDLILTRLSWWIKGWGTPFPYSCEEIIRNPLYLSHGSNLAPLLQCWAQIPISYGLHLQRIFSMECG